MLSLTFIDKDVRRWYGEERRRAGRRSTRLYVLQLIRIATGRPLWALYFRTIASVAVGLLVHVFARTALA
jgi:hypothetical protein